MAHLSIYLTNLGKYNEGELVGEWVDLPVSEEDLYEVYKRIGISDDVDPVTGQVYEETFVTDYETDIPGLYVHEYDSIDHLNEVAESVEGLSDWDIKVLKNAVEAGYIDVDEIENFDSSRFILYEDVYTKQDLGYAMIDMFGGFDALSRDTLENNFDYEAYGRDERLTFHVLDWLDVDEDDPEDVARVCAEYGVDDLDDITVYDYYGVAEGDDEAIGRIIADPISDLDRETFERYFDYDSYASNFINAGVGSFTTDGFIEDTTR